MGMNLGLLLYPENQHSLQRLFITICSTPSQASGTRPGWVTRTRVVAYPGYPYYGRLNMPSTHNSLIGIYCQ
ncbi:hypothetical protein VN97_g7604 [Penicillium thymicola]|uniref:Uncharacterized protein n=1 Tax=Penicillium thymicola TaxID=293382 RepID=A0AAI9X783_PENTH|nr:hypothetical protein VN97_g7604 [Penicillium thymicola]